MPALCIEKFFSGFNEAGISNYLLDDGEAIKKRLPCGKKLGIEADDHGFEITEPLVLAGRYTGLLQSAIDEDFGGKPQVFYTTLEGNRSLRILPITNRESRRIEISSEVEVHPPVKVHDVSGYTYRGH